MSAKDSSEITNIDLVLFALYEIGGAERPVDTEDIAAQVFRYPLGKQRYRWRRYAQYPDKERVSRELRRLKGKKGETFVKGHVNIGAKKDRVDGWMLTPAGVDRVQAFESQLASVLRESTGTHARYDEHTLRRRITGTRCYKMYVKDRTLSATKDHIFTDMLFCLPDASNEKIRAAYDQLLASAKAVGAADLTEFLQAARRRFASFFSNKED